MSLYSDSYGEKKVADVAACHKAMEVLQRHYPNHPWLIGADHDGGVLHCRLQYEAANAGNMNIGYGFMLHLTTVLSPDGERRIRNAGGECLERFGLAREGATESSAQKALENGLNLDGIVTKSRY